eukprot:85598-Pleurochrysis_carterae.AAC.1
MSTKQREERRSPSTAVHRGIERKSDHGERQMPVAQMRANMPIACIASHRFAHLADKRLTIVTLEYKRNGVNREHPCHERSKRRVRRDVWYGNCDSETRQPAYHNEDVVELGVERPGHRL